MCTQYTCYWATVCREYLWNITQKQLPTYINFVSMIRGHIERFVSRPQIQSIKLTINHKRCTPKRMTRMGNIKSIQSNPTRHITAAASGHAPDTIQRHLKLDVEFCGDRDRKIRAGAHRQHNPTTTCYIRTTYMYSWLIHTRTYQLPIRYYVYSDKVVVFTVLYSQVYSQ